MEMFNCKSVCVRVDALLKTLSPAIQEICLQDLELPADQQNAIFHQLYKNLIKGASLIKESENISPFNLPLNYRYASRLLELEKAINDFMGLMPAHILLHMRRLMGDLESVYYPQDIQCLDTRSMLKESILRQASMLTNDPCRNTMMLQQMGSANLIDCTEMVKDSTYSYHDNVPGKSQFNVGMKKSITELKGILFHREVSVVGLQCIGGGGKTTLALALCNDSEIKAFTSTLNSTKLQDFNLDHCSDQEVLPPGICNMQSVQMLSGLTELPSSIGNLVWLEYLDISVCEGLKKLPEEIGKLGKLSEFDMRECSRLRKLPRTVCGLGSLKRVVCDEEIGKQWFRAKRFSLPELEVEIVEAEFNLDWLHD